MTAKDLMTSDPACCTMDTPLEEVARLMVQHDCGEIPVVECGDVKKVVGVVTDRDIVCRTIAEGVNPLSMDAAAVMSSPAVTVTEQDDIDEVILVMEMHQIPARPCGGFPRRVPRNRRARRHRAVRGPGRDRRARLRGLRAGALALREQPELRFVQQRDAVPLLPQALDFHQLQARVAPGHLLHVGPSAHDDGGDR